MKVENAIKKILESSISKESKKNKLFSLGLKQFPNSPNQNKVKKALSEL